MSLAVSRTLRFAAAATLLLAAVAETGAAPLSEYEVKAAFIYNFAKLVEWPAGAIAPGAPFRLCLLGEDPFGPARDVFNGRAVDGHAIEVRQAAASAELKGCQIVFVPASQARGLRAVLDSLRDSPVLTVGDFDGFAQQGVIVNFYRAGENVRFEVNVDAAKRAHLVVSSRLLNLAKIVHDAEARP
jgi:hypothetical protein